MSERRSFLAALPALLLISLFMASGNIALNVFATVQESAKLELGLSDVQLGLIQGLATSIPLAILSIPVGLLVDRVNRVRLLGIMSAVWTAGSLLTAYADSTTTLFVARTLAGLGANISTTIGISIAADLCLPSSRGRSMLLLTLGKYAGVAGAFALGGWLFGQYANAGLAGLNAWRSVHLALGLASAAVTLLILFLREPPRMEIVVANPPIRVVTAELWSRRGFLIPLFFGQTSVLMADASAALWAAPVLQRSYGVTPDQFAGWMGAVILGSGVLGAMLGGVSADLGQRSTRRGGILLGAVIAAAVALPAALFPIAPDTTMFGAALGLLLLGGTMTGLITATTLATLLPNEVRGLSVGAFIAIGGLIAFGVAPALVTLVSRQLGGEQTLATALAIVGLAVSVLGLIGFVVAMRRAPLTIREKAV